MQRGFTRCIICLVYDRRNLRYNDAKKTLPSYAIKLKKNLIEELNKWFGEKSIQSNDWVIFSPEFKDLDELESLLSGAKLVE